MKTQHRILLVLVLMIAFAISGCYYDNEEDLYLGNSPCDTTNVTYSASVAPIFASYCSTCHSGSAPKGDIKTDSYTSVVANIARIQGAVNHRPGFLEMPQNGGRLSECDLTKIDIWIKNGMLNN